MMNAAQMIKSLVWIDLDPRNASRLHLRRLMRERSSSLAAALQGGRGAKIDAVMDETRTVAQMWGIRI